MKYLSKRLKNLHKADIFLANLLLGDFMFVRSLMLVIGLGSMAPGDACAAETVKRTMIVENAEEWGLSLNTGQVISLEGLHWISPGDHWQSLRGLQVSLEKSDFEKIGTDRNRYGDLLGKIMVEPFGWVQEYWIKKGLAVFSGIGPYPIKLRKALLAGEKQARTKRLGAWKRFTVLKADNPAYLLKMQGFRVVEGQIKNVRKFGGTTYLNFGADWKSDFTVAISSTERRNFKKLDWKLKDLDNKWIRIRGVIRSYNGPFMELFFPEQIEFPDENL